MLEEPRRIYVLRKFLPRYISVYDYGGYFFDKFEVTIPPYGSFEAISPDRFLFFAGPAFQEDSLPMSGFLACLKDRDDDTIDVLWGRSSESSDFENLPGYKSGSLISGKYFASAPLFFNENSMMDTVYSVGNDSIYPRYVIEKQQDIMVVPSSFVETPKDIFLVFLYNGFSYLLDYNKASGSVTSMKAQFRYPDDAGRSVRRIENDLDGGISVIPGRTSRDGNIWYYLFNAGVFKRYLIKEQNSGRTILHTEKLQALTRLADSLNDPDRLIIMAVYLKN